MVLLQRSDSLLLQTRAKWQIPNELRPERHPAALRAAIELARELVPDAILRSIAATYNCVGMVVASRRTWVDPSDLIHVLRDDGYRKLNGPEESDVGDVVIYHDSNGLPCHVGLAAYLWLLSERNGDYSTRAAERILECKHCWWARKMANHLQDQRPRSPAKAASSSVES